MIEIKGKYNNAKVFTNLLEDTAQTQIETLCNQTFVNGSSIRIMPDVHAGAGCTIGTTMTITDKVVPNLVGVDIGCGMEVARLANKRLELSKLDKVIHENIPAGFSVRNKTHEFMDQIELLQLKCYDSINAQRAERSIGTLGGGNHFIEVNKDTEGNLYIVIHSGSRNLGKEVASLYQEESFKQLNKNGKTDLDELIASMKEAGREKDIAQAIKAKKAELTTDIPKALAYAEGKLFQDYIHDMKIVQHFAMLNRKAMMKEITKHMKLDIEEQFTTIHNYIDTKNMILRKGAVSAQKDEKILIPINMRDGSLICLGKGNPDWNYSAPHGAGRLMSRAAARNAVTLSQFKKSMEGIFSSTVQRETIDESPFAYKPIENILDNIAPTAEVLIHIKPIYNFKAAE